MSVSSSPMHVHPARPSDWIVRWSRLIPAGGDVLDVACGSGRHSLFLARQGWRVFAVDRDASAITALSAEPRIAALQADIEADPWPYGRRTFAAIIVTNYLHRPLLPTLVDSIADGGILLFETFAQGNEKFGRPSNPDFLLRHGELLEAVRGELRVIAYEDVQVDEPHAAMVQRICARRE